MCLSEHTYFALHMYTHTHTHTHIHTHCTCTRTLTLTPTYTHALHTHTHTHIHTCIAHAHALSHSHAHIHTRIAHVHAHAHPHAQPRTLPFAVEGKLESAFRQESARFCSDNKPGAKGDFLFVCIGMKGTLASEVHTIKRVTRCVMLSSNMQKDLGILFSNAY